MQENQNESKLGMRRILAIILIIGAVLFATYWNIRLNAEESPSIVGLKEYLQKDMSFYVQPEGWLERIAMQRVINQYNKEQGYSTKEEMYRTYKFTDTAYWVTSENLTYYEFYSEARDYSLYLAEMLLGLRQESETFDFCCLDEVLENEFKGILEMSSMAADELEFEIGKREGKEVTIFFITVEPKTQVGKGVI